MSGLLVSAVVLSAWLGCALLVAAVVAPAAFAVLPTRSLAGALVGRVLPAVFYSGMAAGLLAAALTWSIPPRGWRTGTAVALVAACAFAQLLVAPRIAGMRAAIGGPLDALDPSDPRREAFGRLHGISVAWMGVGMLAAFACLAITLRHTSIRTAP